MMMRTVGLDFGQSECRLAYCADSRPAPLPQATRLSQVWLDYKGKARVPRASDQAGPGATGAAFDFKTALGERSPIPLGRHLAAPIGLAKAVMQAVRAEAERLLRVPLTHAVVTVPARATEPQRAALRSAAGAAGFTGVRLISETLAAAIYARRTRGGDGWYLVYHLAAGPFEAAIVRVDGTRFEAAGVAGDPAFHGRAADGWIAARLAEQMADQGWVLPDTQVARSQMLRLAEEVKIELLVSSQWRSAGSPRLARPTGSSGTSQRAGLDLAIKRADLERWLRPQVEASFEHVQQALAQAGLAPSDLAVVLGVGSTAALPVVDALCMDSLDHGRLALGPDAVSLGAALHSLTIAESDWTGTSPPPRRSGSHPGPRY